MDRELSDIRKDFEKFDLNIENLDENPFLQAESWIQNAIELNQPEPTAMHISTIDEKMMPHSRMVLLKGIEDGFVFYTNYNSTKGKNIEFCKNVSAHFFWPSLERQIQINGTVEKVAPKLSDEYFASRPRESQIGAWASSQSSEIEYYEILEERVEFFTKKFKGVEVPRPPHWGGYVIKPSVFEFWQGRPSRLHKRFKYELLNGIWKIKMLAP